MSRSCSGTAAQRETTCLASLAAVLRNRNAADADQARDVLDPLLADIEIEGQPVANPCPSPLASLGVSEFDQGKAEGRNEEPGSSAHEQRPPALCPQFADIRLEAHRREGDRQKEGGRLDEVDLVDMRDQIEAVEQHHRDEPQHEPRRRHGLGRRPPPTITVRALRAPCAEVAERQDHWRQQH